MAVSPRKVKNKRDANGSLTGRAGTVYDVNIKYTSPDGKKSTYSKKGFLTRKEAEGHEAEIKAKLQAPTFAATVKEQRRQTVKDYLQEWVESYARVNLRPSTYDGYKRTIANYIVPYIGNVPLNQLSGQTVDKMFQDIIDKGLKPSTAAGAKRVLSVALNHARKYHFIETNAARDTLTKFGKGDKTPDPYTPEQVRALLERVAGTEWEMPVVLGGLYGMRRSEVLGLRWRNVDLEKGTFDVVEQLPFHVPPYYDNDLVICKANGAPQAANWISSGFGKLLAGLDMPHIRYHDLRHTAATNMHQLTGDFYTVGEVLGHTLAGIGASLGLSMNFEAVTARYVDVRLERKQEVLDAYHAAVHPKPKQARQTTPKQEKQTPKRKAPEMTL